MTTRQVPDSIDLRYLRLYTLFAGVAAIAVGTLVLLGWMLDLTALKSVLSGKVMMKPNGAICFGLSGAALVLMTIATGISATKTGFELIRSVRELVRRPEVDGAEVAARLLELQDLMLDARNALSEAESKKRTLSLLLVREEACLHRLV